MSIEREIVTKLISIFNSSKLCLYYLLFHLHPLRWIPHFLSITNTQDAITWPGGRRSAKYGLRFGVIYNPPKCQVGSVCWNLLDCIKACSVVMVAPCLQGGPRLVAHRLRWGPHDDTCTKNARWIDANRVPHDESFPNRVKQGVMDTMNRLRTVLQR